MRGNGLPRDQEQRNQARRGKGETQRKTKEIAEPVEQARLMVCGAERASISDLNKKLPPNSVYMGRSWGPPWRSRRLGKPVQGSKSKRTMPRWRASEVQGIPHKPVRKMAALPVPRAG